MIDPNRRRFLMASLMFGTAVKAAVEKTIEQAGKRMDFVLIDTESGEEYIPQTKLSELVKQLPLKRNGEVILYCRKPT